MSPGELLTRWSVRLALALYVAALCVFLSSRGLPSWDRRARWLWTGGLAAFLVHVVRAFHYYHGWSHSAAWRDTARQTGELTGWNWGGGVWFNYAFAAVWAADVLWWWLGGLCDYRNRAAAVAWPIHAFLAFIAFNATVVFETGTVRWSGVAATIVLLALAWRELRDP